ncbi:hypothetical protein SDC9_98092 [bioreactor metagenome]|uniref:Uncharacterized protein n=1 Tax=bioreactor metagenome TaxID=1076179 RepID=A0A645AP13_9ZZZZ
MNNVTHIKPPLNYYKKTRSLVLSFNKYIIQLWRSYDTSYNYLFNYEQSLNFVKFSADSDLFSYTYSR